MIRSLRCPVLWKESELGEEGTGKCLCWTTRRAFWGEGVQKGEFTYGSTHERSYESSTRVTREFTRDWGKKLRCISANGGLPATADRDGCGVCGGRRLASNRPIGTTQRRGFGPIPSTATAIRGFAGSLCNNILFIKQKIIEKSRQRTRERRQRGQTTGGLPAFSRTLLPATRPEYRTSARTASHNELRLHGSSRSPAEADPAGS